MLDDKRQNITVEKYALMHKILGIRWKFGSVACLLIKVL